MCVAEARRFSIYAIALTSAASLFTCQLTEYENYREKSSKGILGLFCFAF